ncbi:MAG TPA: hypothetical protein VJS64_08280 [Pyrinomonadaceae bacterium]|nr:hypothetical protein [Pyrinomonadaceae bacterium]
MWWSIIFGVFCVVTAILLLIVERKSNKRTHERAPEAPPPWRRPRLTAKSRAARPSASNARILKDDGVIFTMLLYALRAAIECGHVLRALWRGMGQTFGKAFEQAQSTRREKQNRTMHAQFQDNDATPSDETINRIKEKGLLPFLKNEDRE